MNKRIILIWVTLALFSCNDSEHKSHGPIVLGDSSTIVTEKDKSRLQDLVTDLHPNIQHEEPKEDTETKTGKDQPLTKTDTPTKSTPPPPASKALPQVAGLKAEFKETSILIPNINAKQAGDPNLQNTNGAVFTLNSGTINGNVLHTTGNVLKVSQRYISIVVIKNNSGILPLESLTETTSWEPLKGSNGIYPIAGLDEDNLEFPKAPSAVIRNAVVKTAQHRRLNKKKIQEWESTASHAKAPNQKPCSIMLRSVMWKVDGRDADGKPFSKQIRIDVPM